MRDTSYIVGLVLLTSLFALTMFALDTGARQVLESDDFDGTDGTAPNSTMWEAVRTDSNEYCELRGNTLWTHSTGNGYSYVRGKNHHEPNNLTLLVEVRIRNQMFRNDSRGLPTIYFRGHNPLPRMCSGSRDQPPSLIHLVAVQRNDACEFRLWQISARGHVAVSLSK